jgi:UDP-N-acetylmuramoylalanine--D-glutamate ligase
MPGSTVLVHGLGRFGGGREAVRFLSRRGCRVRVADRSATDELLAVQRALADLPGVDWRLGSEDEALLDGVDAMVANPAVPDQHPLLAAARRRGIGVTQEVDLFLAHYPGRVIAITGTNGKSSTSMLLHRALAAAGLDALLGGNIGHSLLAEQANWRQGQWAVLEISSFQLERLDERRRVTGAVFTRVLRDHVDRHGTLEAYHAAKGRLAPAATDFVVHAADDPVAGAYRTGAAQRGYFAADRPGPCSASVVDGFVHVRTDRTTATIVHADALQLLGPFQLENVMAASLAAALAGASPHGIGLAMATAAPLPFRLQLVRTLGGVRVYDNGVSTEVDSTRSALETLQRLGGRIRWIGGGKSKDGDYARVAAGTAPFVASAHLFGAAAEPLGKALTAPTTVHTTLKEAFAAAMAAALPGDAVLFSPAFASFDQYANFRQRAQEFHALLAERSASNPS